MTVDPPETRVPYVPYVVAPKVPLSCKVWLAAGIGALVLSGLGFLLTAATWLGEGESSYESYGARTIATVTAMDREHYASPDYAPCSPTYRWEVDGVSYSAHSPAEGEYFCGLEVGGPVEITYDPADPGLRNAPVRHSSVVPWLAGTTAALFLVSIAAFVLSARHTPSSRARRATKQAGVTAA